MFLKEPSKGKEQGYSNDAREKTAAQFLGGGNRGEVDSQGSNCRVWEKKKRHLGWPSNTKKAGRTPYRGGAYGSSEKKKKPAIGPGAKKEDQAKEKDRSNWI